MWSRLSTNRAPTIWSPLSHKDLTPLKVVHGTLAAHRLGSNPSIADSDIRLVTNGKDLHAVFGLRREVCKRYKSVLNLERRPTDQVDKHPISSNLSRDIPRHARRSGQARRHHLLSSSQDGASTSKVENVHPTLLSVVRLHLQHHSDGIFGHRH